MQRGKKGRKNPGPFRKAIAVRQACVVADIDRRLGELYFLLYVQTERAPLVDVKARTVSRWPSVRTAFFP